MLGSFFPILSAAQYPNISPNILLHFIKFYKRLPAIFRHVKLTLNKLNQGYIMTITIPLTQTFNMRLCCTRSSVPDLNMAVKAKLKPNETLGNKTALKILTDIKISYAVKAFFTQPLVLFAIGAITLVAGLALSSLSGGLAFPIITAIAGIALSGLGAGIIGFTLENSLCGDKLIPHLHAFYTAQNREAERHIKTIKKAQADGTELKYDLSSTSVSSLPSFLYL